MLRTPFSLVCFIALASAAKNGPSHLDTLVTFGDSYTDAVVTGDNATAWPVYAAGYAHATLRPFARSGGTCTNTLTPRTFPSVMESQVPLYLEEVRNRSLRVDYEKALYTLWIGTNDLGPNTLLTGDEVMPNATIASVTACTIDWAKELYATGVRNFLFQNIIPLERLPIYSVDSYPNRYWTAERNTTEWHLFIHELAVAGNTISRLMWESLPAKLPHAHIGYFDSHALFTDILDDPRKFLNGTLASPNITGAINACVFQLNESTSGPADCTVAQGSDRDSFMWYDELHPSEQVDRVVAREIAAVLEGRGSKYATWFS
ncbi:unnamed protein product [Peniophora sp. CBMAI 1063]|nr:unnamed protein product [Peniophora sp. CBMAI 1063]